MHQPVQLEGRSAPRQAEGSGGVVAANGAAAEATKSNSFRRFSSPREATAAILRFQGDRLIKSA